MNKGNVSFVGIRGVQAGTEYYVCMISLDSLSKLFVFTDSEMPASIRAQRVLNKTRIPEMKNYILNNPTSYVFSALTASIDGDVKFSPLVGTDTHSSIGTIEISLDSRIVINDGQHRMAAVEAAIKEKPSLRHEDIAMVLFIDSGLKRAQQMFSDLNRYAIRPTKSLNILYNSREPFSQMMCKLINDMPMFGKWVEREKASLSNRSIALFTLSGIYASSRILITGLREKESTDENIIREFWKTAYEATPEWQLVTKGKMRASKLRQESLCAHVVAHRALAIAGNGLLLNKVSLSELLRIGRIDWSKTNPVWAGHAIVNGKISGSNSSMLYIADVLKRAITEG